MLDATVRVKNLGLDDDRTCSRVFAGATWVTRWELPQEERK
jgi:hypothetical protein